MLDIWREVSQLRDFLPTRSKMTFSKPGIVCSKKGAEKCRALRSRISKPPWLLF